MQNTSPIWKWLWEDGEKNLPSADYSGAVVSFDNPGYTYPKDITVDIDPVQDLHGYDNPWPGGGGKNLFGGQVNEYFPLFIPSGATVCAYVDSRATIAYYKQDGTTQIDYWSIQQGVARTFSIIEDAYYFRYFTVSGDPAPTKMYIAIENSFSGYTPYSNICPISGWTGCNISHSGEDTSDPTVIPISWQSEAGTVYCGTRDVTTGLLTVTMAEVDLGTLNWVFVETPYHAKRYYTGSLLTRNIRVASSNAIAGNLICSAFINKSANEGYAGLYLDCVTVDTNGTVSIYPSTEYASANDFKTAMSGVQLVYELATPITYDIDPVTLTLLRGNNNVWADCGDIAVSLESPMDVKLEAKAIIAGVEYTDISAPVINRALMQNGLSVGNAVACTCSFTVRGAGTIPRSAEVIIKARLTDGTQTSEWLTCGTFYVSRRRRDAVTGLVELECYDAMLKANATYEASGAWPRPMADVVTEIAALLGVAIDPRTQINTGSAYMVSLPEVWDTINTILADIATAHGGNWIITPAGMLRLVPLTSASGAAGAAEAVEVEGIIGSLTVGATQEVTGIRVAGDDGDTMIGDDSGLVVNIDSQYVNETSAAALGVMLIGQTYQPYTMTQAVHDPAAELGDYLRGGAEDEVNSVLYGEVATLGAAYRANITALEVAEIADEYPYIGGNEAVAEQVRRLSSVVADKASIEDLEAVDARLDHLSASDIKAGIIHSADYETVEIPLIYPASDLYPAADLNPNYGERVIRGFAIDFSTGQIYGAFYSTQIEQLQEAVEALQNSLIYPKAETTTLSHMELYPFTLASVKVAMKKEDEE